MELSDKIYDMANRQLFSRNLFNFEADLRKHGLSHEVQSYEMDAILATPLEDLEKYFEDKYKMNAPQLRRDELHLLEKPLETISGNRNYIQFTICLPFEGDASIFELQPTHYQIPTMGLNASILENEIRLAYNEQARDQEDLEKLYIKDVNMIESNAKSLTDDVNRFNAELLPLIKRKLTERKQNAEKNKSIIQSFKIPIKKRENVPATYSIPNVQRKPKMLELPKTKTLTQEPTLAADVYEDVLTIIKDMALAMERSPKTFATLKEEDIRNFFIILLNGHYQGSATGETFNGNGKTDILIRHENENAFIAECKFWNGQKKLVEAVDQLLGYVTWRDTKTSIILFNRQPDLTSVISKANHSLKEHKYFKSEWSFTSKVLNNLETVFGYKFVHPSDAEKEIFLTLMAFQIDLPS